MTDMKLQFTIQAVDAVTAVGNRILQNAKGLAHGLGSVFKGISAASDRISGSYGSMAAAIGGGLELRELIGAQEYWKRLQAQYGLTASAADNLRDHVLGAATAGKVSAADMEAALEGYRDAGGALEAFGQHAETAASLVQLLGGQGDAVGRVMAAFRERFGITGVDELRRSMAVLNEQTRSVPGGLAQAAQSMNALAESYAALGHQGPQAARELGATYAVIATGAKSGREAFGQMQMLFELLSTFKGREELVSMGIKVSANDKDLMAGRTLPLPEIMSSFAKVYSSSPAMAALLSNRLGDEFIRPMSTMIADVQNTGKPLTLDAKMGVSGDPSKLMKDASIAADTLQGSLDRLRASISLFGEQHLDGPLKRLADVLDAFGTPILWAINLLGGFIILGKVAGWTIEAAGAFRALAGGVLLVGPALVSVLGWLAAGAESMAGMVAGVPILSAALGMAANAFLGLGVAIEATPIGWIITAVAAIAGAVYLIYENWGGITAWFGHIWQGIKDIFGGFLAFFVGIFTGNLARAGDGLKRVFQGLKEYILAWIKGITMPIGVLVEWIDRTLGTHIGKTLTDTRDAVFGRAPAASGQAPSARPRASESIAGARGGAKVGGVLRIQIDGAPPGTRVKELKSDNPNVPIDLSMGFGMYTP